MTISVKHVNQLKSAFFYAVEAGTPEKIFSDEIKSLLPKDKELKVLSLENDFLLIYDEVQTGIGITGKMWAHQYFKPKNEEYSHCIKMEPEIQQHF